MHLLIDRATRDALYDACSCDIEAVSNIQIDTAQGAKIASDLWRHLKAAGPVLDQIGWQAEDDREVFDVRVNARRMPPFLRHHIRGTQGLLAESVTTERELDESLARQAHYTGKPVSREERAHELAEMRAQVDRDLEMLAAYRRLLEAIETTSPSVTELEAVS